MSTPTKQELDAIHCETMARFLADLKANGLSAYDLYAHALALDIIEISKNPDHEFESVAHAWHESRAAELDDGRDSAIDLFCAVADELLALGHDVSDHEEE